MQYRLARVSDHEGLAQLRWEHRTNEDGENPAVNCQTFTEACQRFFHDGLTDDSLVCWLALEGTTIVSVACIQRVPLIPRPCRIQDQFGVITDAYTLPDWRNRGIGTRLMTRAIQWAADLDLELLIVWPSDRATSFYRRLGFRSDNDVTQLTLRPYYAVDTSSATSD